MDEHESALSAESDGGSYRRLGPLVRPADAGRRLDGYLAADFPFLTRAGWQKRLATGELLVDGRAVKASYRLRAGDEVTMYAPHVAEPEVARDIRVLWRQGAVMAVYKPGNLPMHENGPYRKNTFTELVWQELGREWSAVHRLDRETSGIVLCGATSAARAALATAFESRAVDKEYLAIARGLPSERWWVCEGPIGDLRQSAIRIKKWVVPDGLPAATEFEVLDTAPAACLLAARPRTGRTNQIRIHAAHRGHVLYGDKLYHDDEAVFLEYFERGPTANVVAQAGFRRLCLHAARLAFTHPESGAACEVECPLPEELVGFWGTLLDAAPAVELRGGDQVGRPVV